MRRALELADEGLATAAIANAVGVSRTTVASWLQSDAASLLARRDNLSCTGDEACATVSSVPAADYTYLLGLYLGDGCISVSAKGVPRLRIKCCDDYPALMSRCESAMAAVAMNHAIGRTQCDGCTEVRADYRHWACLFPQHGPGKKHERRIALLPWQKELTATHPFELLAGLIHSDGCRVINRVRACGRVYEYPRYFFCNVSADIQRVFCDTCDAVGVEWRKNRWNSISVARRASVAKLDAFVPPKR